ncbi:hypothetical protein N7488_012110 [Penicillium malachiteum]|nr:hypothetical protein N7488_012110 [Penicillium malachiteum]
MFVGQLHELPLHIFPLANHQSVEFRLNSNHPIQNGSPKLKKPWGKNTTTRSSKETGGLSSSTANIPKSGPAGSSSATTTTKQSPERVVSSSPLSTNAVSILPVASSKPRASDTVALSLSDKFEPWAEGYKFLEQREPELMEDYKKHLLSLHDLVTDGGSTSWSVDAIVRKLLENREKKQWRVSLLGKDVKMREQCERLAKFLLWSNPVVQSAVSTQPYAALAWSGVSLLLPLLTSSTTKNEAMLKGFNSIGDIQVYWEICERTYLRPSHRHGYQELIEPLVKLYSHIEEYQARAICHLSSAQLSRAWQNVAGWSDWDGKVTLIDDLSKQCNSRIKPYEVEETRAQWERQLQEMQTSQKILNDIWDVLQTNKKEAQMNYEDQKERVLLQDLASNYQDFKDFNPLRVQGTCEWFFADDRFCDWRDSRTSGLLWVSAGPGCGKSVLSRALIDQRRLTTQVTTSRICHFFFKDGDERRMHPANALCAILHQLFMHDPSGAIYGTNLSQNFGELWEILIDCAGSMDTGELVCVIDALDECKEDGRLQFIDQLKSVYCQPWSSSNPLSKLKFLITSRPYYDIETSFKGFSGTTTYLHFDGDQKSALIGNEINLVIEARVNEIGHDFEAADRQIIAEKLKSMEQRTYLWLHLTFDIIKRSSAYSKRCDIEELLSSLPSKISEAYEKILERSDDRMQTELLLQIVLAAARPLTLDEANEALTLASQGQDVVSHSDLSNKLWPKKGFESTVKNLCGLFISVYDSKLSFIHQTAREFLTDSAREGKWQGRLNDLRAHSMMALVSLRYLSFLDVQGSFREIGAKFPLAHNSALYWAHHARPVEAENNVQKSILDFFLRQEQAYNAWVKLIDPDKLGLFLAPRHYGKYMGSPLYYASLMNLPHSVKLLLDTAIDINAIYGPWGTALQAACFEGHMDVVQLLLTRGSDVKTDGSQGTALEIAFGSGHKGLLQLLLDNGADVNAQVGKYGNALQAACYRGDIEIVQLFLNNGADVNAQGGKYGNALQAACCRGIVEVVRLLLDSGADVNAQGGLYSSALDAAYNRDHKDIVQLLLDRGADPLELEQAS